MDNFNIESDLTVTNTKLTIDGKEVTKKEKVVGISFYASSPVKDSEYESGWIDLNLTTVDENGNVENKSYRKSEYIASKIPMGQTIKDFLDTKGIDQVVRYIGSDVEKNIKEVSNKIIDYCSDNKLKCPDADVLCSRTLQSLKDKAEDLGLEDKDNSKGK